MPDSNGRFRGISVPALPWLDGGDDEEFAVRVGQVVEAEVVCPPMWAGMTRTLDDGRQVFACGACPDAGACADASACARHEGAGS